MTLSKKEDQNILKEVGSILKQTFDNFNNKPKKRFKISVVKFKDITCNHDNLRNTEIVVWGRDEVDAIIEHNKVFKNYDDVENYLIIGNGKITTTDLKKRSSKISELDLIFEGAQ
tara:strand:+ start:158 stop:502 length:345 start_codon:yes stop_codon:yes gene_type:complete